MSAQPLRLVPLFTSVLIAIMGTYRHRGPHGLEPWILGSLLISKITRPDSDNSAALFAGTRKLTIGRNLNKGR
jgi:hypothetical protein